MGIDKVTPESDDFLNDSQKEIRRKIMEDLFNALYDNVQNNLNLFDNQTLMDLLVSIFIMFNRDFLLRILFSSNAMQKKEEFINGLFREIKEQVDMSIKKNVN